MLVHNLFPKFSLKELKSDLSGLGCSQILLGSLDITETSFIDDSEGFYLTNYIDSINEASLNFTDILFFDRAFTPDELSRLMHIFSF